MLTLRNGHGIFDACEGDIPLRFDIRRCNVEIRIKISEDEYKDIVARSESAGFPSINAYARELLFPQHNYKHKWAEVKAYIDKLKPGDIFFIRDALPNTPALFGRWAFEQQKELGIESDGKDRTGTNRWRKL